MGFFAFLFVYILGGLTFIPLCIIGAIYYIKNYHSIPIDPAAKENNGSIPPPETSSDPSIKTNDEKLLNKLKSEPEVAAGYFAVTREWTPGGINGKPPERMTPVGSASIKGEEPSQSMYQTVVRSIFDRKGGGKESGNSGAAKKKRASNVFYVVLRHGHLMLYDDSEQLEVRHVVSLSHHTISIYGGGEVIPEGELWIRRNAICLSRTGTDSALANANAAHSKPFYLFSENCSEKEDFYFALLRNQEKAAEDDPASGPPTPLGFDPAHLILLVQQLHSSEEHLQTRWLNALLGRVFLALYKTPDIENFFRSKITKKIARVKKPAFLNDIIIQKVDVGEGAPYITNPRLRDLNVDGECVVEANVSYSGNFRLEIFTAARLDLGARFKTREVDLILAAVLKKLEGKVIIRIKPPPSNRIWLAFETMPKMELNIEPIVSTMQITYRPILQLIENRVREVIMETLVLPHYDDLPFTDTINQTFRGGIWRQPPKPSGPSASEPALVVGENDQESAVDESVIGSSPNHKSASMPNLASISPGMDGKKFSPSPSTIPVPEIVVANGATASGGSGAGLDTSGLTHREHRKPKSLRNHSFTQIAAQPLVSTDNINVTAVRGESTTSMESDNKARTAVKATFDRSRSVSSASGSPKGTPVGSPSNPVPALVQSSASSTSSASVREKLQQQQPKEEEKKDEFYLALEEPVDGNPTGGTGTRHGRSQSMASTMSAVTAPSLPSTPPMSYSGGISSRNISASTSPMLSARNNSNLSAAFHNHHHHHQQQQQQQNHHPQPNGTPAKPAVINAAINATAAVKKWYKGRTEGNSNIAPQLNSPNTEIREFLQGAYLNNHHKRTSSVNNNSSQQQQNTPQRRLSPLPPPEIPPPPPKRTAPIAVPKRKPLPPPSLPARNKIAAAQHHQQGDVVDDVMIVAAPPADDDDLMGSAGYGGGVGETADDESSSDDEAPDEFMVSLDGNTVHRHNSSGSGGGLAGLGLMLGRDKNPAGTPARRNSGGSGNGNGNGNVVTMSASNWDHQQPPQQQFMGQRARGGSQGSGGIGGMSVKKNAGSKAGRSTGIGGMNMDEEDELWHSAAVDEAELTKRGGAARGGGGGGAGTWFPDEIRS